MSTPPVSRKRSLEISKDEESKKGESSDVNLLDDMLREARKMRATATTLDTLEHVKGVLQTIIEKAKPDSSEWMDAGMFLATLLLQQDNLSDKVLQKASQLLDERGFPYRLARAALLPPPDSASSSSSPPLHLAQAHDNVLSPSLLHRLTDTFQPSSEFWSFHNYSDGSTSGSPASPYVSYVVPLSSSLPPDKMATDSPHLQSSPLRDTPLLQIIRSIQDCVAQHVPSVLQASAAEWWAHCRPHSSGHQFHFDSDDEGRGGIVRNPIVSCVVYLTDSQSGGGCTLVTTQTSKQNRILAKEAWQCSSRRNRVLCFQGNLLHGVVPGAGVCPDGDAASRRVTFMVAFWKKIRIQDSPGFGAARPFSRVQAEGWAKPLVEKLGKNEADSATRAIQATLATGCFVPVPLWVDVDEPLNESRGESLLQLQKRRRLPPYDAFFQFYS